MPGQKKLGIDGLGTRGSRDHQFLALVANPAAPPHVCLPAALLGCLVIDEVYERMEIHQYVPHLVHQRFPIFLREFQHIGSADSPSDGQIGEVDSIQEAIKIVIQRRMWVFQPVGVAGSVVVSVKLCDGIVVILLSLPLSAIAYPLFCKRMPWPDAASSAGSGPGK